MAEKMQALPPDVQEAMQNDDYAKLYELIVPLAERGGDLAQSLLGVLYENGIGVSKDMAKAIEWYRKAGEQGDLRSQMNLGDIYRAGRDVAQDKVQAKLWYTRAAEQGNIGAEQMLARFLHDEGDELGAVPWLRKLTEAGDDDGRSRLNGIVLSPRAEAKPAFCYVETEGARVMFPMIPTEQGGLAMIMHAQAGCGMRVGWDVKSGYQKPAELETALGQRSIAEINDAGFEILPHDLKLQFDGCPADWRSATTLAQDGYVLKLKAGDKDISGLTFGAIIGNHIVFLNGLMVEFEQYIGLIALVPAFVSGDWQDGRAELTSPSGDCKVVVTSAE
ncbi:MAG TPA: tetratricopeptide repeat protein [Devosia sp.]|nr:tetratricopeptide repeat protein [Devosia sp.]